MMRAARDILEGENRRPRLIGVTVLTSLSQKSLQELSVSRDLESQVDHLARLAHTCGLDGIVCSAQETQSAVQSLGGEFCLVTPGIRPRWAASDDQTRIVTPTDAIADGSDYLVIGRPITNAECPEHAVARIVDEI